VRGGVAHLHVGMCEGRCAALVRASEFEPYQRLICGARNILVPGCYWSKHTTYVKVVSTHIYPGLRT